MVSHTMEISAKCGCNYTATKRISKTASITSISKTQRATRFDVWSSIRLIAAVFLMTQLLAIGQVDAMTLRPRHLRKRHSSNDVTGVWQNPCGGTFQESPDDGRKEKRNPSLNLLHDALRLKYAELNSARDEGIDISDISMWSAHNGTYKFVPKLRVKRNSTIALRRWYRNFQVFVAAFSYLNSTQEKLDLRRPQRSPISDELHKMLHNARALLCEIETAINRTTPYKRERKLTWITREQMNDRLNFRTKKHLADNVYQVDSLDLKFMKYYLLEYLHNMSIIIARKDKNGNRKLDDNSKSESTNISDSSSVSASRSVTSNEVYPHRKRQGGGGKKKKNQDQRKKNNQKKNRARLHKNDSLPRSID